MADRILALDLGDLLGFCHGVPGGKPVYGTHQFPAGGSVTVGHMGVLLESFIVDIVKGNDIRRIVFEKPIMPGTTSFQAMSKMLGRSVVVSMAGYRLGLSTFPVDQQTWRSQFGMPTQAPRKIKDKAERRRFMKEQALARCRVFGFDPKDDNAADAIGIWWSACEKDLAKVRAPNLFDTLDV